MQSGGNSPDLIHESFMNEADGGTLNMTGSKQGHAALAGIGAGHGDSPENIKGQEKCASTGGGAAGGRETQEGREAGEVWQREISASSSSMALSHACMCGSSALPVRSPHAARDMRFAT